MFFPRIELDKVSLLYSHRVNIAWPFLLLSHVKAHNINQPQIPSKQLGMTNGNARLGRIAD